MMALVNAISDVDQARPEFKLFVSDGCDAPSLEYRVLNVERDIFYNPEILNNFNLDGWIPVHCDLLILIAAIEYADKIHPRPRWGWKRVFRIVLPVFQIGTWKMHQVQQTLCAALRKLTGDEWHFEFYKSSRFFVKKRQDNLQIITQGIKHIIPYSDGADSRSVSGLYPQNEIAPVRISSRRSRRNEGGRPFDFLQLRVKISGSQESSAFSRGFTFACVTAICSHLANASSIIVPESGQGVFGSVLLPKRGVPTDYRTHPAFFRLMEKFIFWVLGYSVVYEQPRLWSTKSQTIQEYISHARSSEYAKLDLMRSRSCWQSRWNVRFLGDYRQCGICLACILRRMSFYNAHVNEPDNMYTVSHLDRADIGSAIPKNYIPYINGPRLIKHGVSGAIHLERFGFLTSNPSVFPTTSIVEIANSTGNMESDVLSLLKILCECHREEWNNFLHHLGSENLLSKWVKGISHE